MVRQNRSVITAYCTCMAGLGEDCSHIAALSFKLELACSLKMNGTPADVACKWNNSFSSKKEKPAVILLLYYSRCNWKAL